MVAEADRIRDNNPRGALQLGVAANQLNPSPLTQESLTQTLVSSRYRGTLTGHTNEVNSVVFSADGRTLATAGRDNIIILWDVADPTQPRRLGEALTGHTGSVNSVAFSPDRRTLATASGDRTINLWDLSDLGQPLAAFAGSVAFSPDGRTLAIPSEDRAVTLWDVTDRSQPRWLGGPLPGHTSGARSVAFSLDGRTLVTVSGDQTVTLWDMTWLAELRRNAVSEACIRTGGSLDKATWDFYAPGLRYQNTCTGR